MKVRSSVKRLCDTCQIIIRSQSLGNGKNKKRVRRVICKNRRHNQRQG